MIALTKYLLAPAAAGNPTLGPLAPTHVLLLHAGYDYIPGTGRVVLSDTARADTKMQWANGATLNRIARKTLAKYDIPVMPAFNISAPLVDNHVGLRMSASPDCLHYCNPGVPEVRAHTATVTQVEHAGVCLLL